MTQKKPRMTVGQFMKRLAKYKGEFHVDAADMIVTHGVDAEGCVVHCPLTRMALSETGRQLALGNYRSAGNDLGLPDWIVTAIASAAALKEGLTPLEKKYRARMLEVLGLKEVS